MHIYATISNTRYFKNTLKIKDMRSWSVCAVLSRSVVYDSFWPHWVAHQAPLSMGNLQTRILKWVAMPSPRGIFPTQGSVSGLPHCWWSIHCLDHQGSPRILEWVTYPFSRGAFRPRNHTGVFCTAGGFFTSWATIDGLIKNNFS